jgi:hypothetical protein
MDSDDQGSQRFGTDPSTVRELLWRGLADVYVWLLETAREMEALLTDMTEEKIALLAR